MEFTSDWFSHHADIWRKVVVPQLPAPEQPLAWLEIGSYEGRSAAWVLDNVICGQPHRTLTCVDTWVVAGTEPRFDANIGDRVVKIKKDGSQTLLDMIAAGQVFDCIYLDGDHDGRVTLENAVLAWRTLKNFGVLIFDDYPHRIAYQYSAGRLNAAAGIDAFLAAYKLNLRVLYHNWQVIVQKLPLVR